MFTQLSPHDWLGLYSDDKEKLKSQFKIPRSGATHVAGNVVQTDGHTVADLSRLSIQSLQEYTGLTSTNFVDLFTQTLIKLNPERYAKETDQTPEVGAEAVNGETRLDEKESEEPTMAIPAEECKECGRGKDDCPGSCHRNGAGVRESTDGTKNISPEVSTTPRRGRPKKQVQ